MKFQIGDDLQTIQTAQVVDSNHQGLCSDLSPDDIILAGSEICQMDGEHQNIKTFAVPILCNA